MKTLKLEKAQVSALARFLGRMLAELARPGELPTGAELALEPFGEPDFVVRSLGVSYDEELDRIILVAEEIDRTEPEEEAEEFFGLVEDIELEDGGRRRGKCAGVNHQRAGRSIWPFAGPSSSRLAGPHARCAGTRSTREATCARGRTATARP